MPDSVCSFDLFYNDPGPVAGQCYMRCKNTVYQS